MSKKKDLRPKWDSSEEAVVRKHLRNAVTFIVAETGRWENGVKKHIRKLFAEGKPIFLLLVTLCLSACALMTGCSGDWSAMSASNYETTTVAAMYSPDPNGAVGLRAMTDSKITGETWEGDVAAGPAMEFALSDIAAMAVDRMVPSEWPSLANAPVKLFGTMALLWEFDDGDILFLPGVRLQFELDAPVKPFVSVERLTPEHSSDVEQDTLTMFGGIYRFK